MNKILSIIECYCNKCEFGSKNNGGTLCKQHGCRPGVFNYSHFKPITPEPTIRKTCATCRFGRANTGANIFTSCKEVRGGDDPVCNRHSSWEAISEATPPTDAERITAVEKQMEKLNNLFDPVKLTNSFIEAFQPTVEKIAERQAEIEKQMEALQQGDKKLHKRVYELEQKLEECLTAPSSLRLVEEPKPVCYDRYGVPGFLGDAALVFWMGGSSIDRLDDVCVLDTDGFKYTSSLKSNQRITHMLNFSKTEPNKHIIFLKGWTNS